MVQTAAQFIGPDSGDRSLTRSPRRSRQHYYNAKHSKLIDLGLKPHFLSDSLLDSLMNIAVKYSDRIDRSTLYPTVNWRNVRNERRPALVLPDPVTQ